MKLGNRIYQIIILCFFFFNYSNADEKITTTPLINKDQIKPSFEELIDENENLSLNHNLKEKKNLKNLKPSQAILIGLDKITAKSSELVVNINEIFSFSLTNSSKLGFIFSMLIKGVVIILSSALEKFNNRKNKNVI